MTILTAWIIMDKVTEPLAYCWTPPAAFASLGCNMCMKKVALTGTVSWSLLHIGHTADSFDDSSGTVQFTLFLVRKVTAIRGRAHASHVHWVVQELDCGWPNCPSPGWTCLGCSGRPGHPPELRAHLAGSRSHTQHCSGWTASLHLVRRAPTSIADLSFDLPVLWLWQSVHSGGVQEGLVRCWPCCGFLDGELVYGWKAVGMDIGLTGHAHVRLLVGWMCGHQHTGWVGLPPDVDITPRPPNLQPLMKYLRNLQNVREGHLITES